LAALSPFIFSLSARTAAHFQLMSLFARLHFLPSALALNGAFPNKRFKLNLACLRLEFLQINETILPSNSGVSNIINIQISLK